MLHLIQVIQIAPRKEKQNDLHKKSTSRYSGRNKKRLESRSSETGEIAERFTDGDVQRLPCQQKVKADQHATAITRF